MFARMACNTISNILSSSRRIIALEHQSMRSCSRTFSQFARARRRLEQTPQKYMSVQSRRLLSSTSSQRLADVNDTVDPRQIGRECDEVDVCIVGGGESDHPSAPSPI